MSFEDFPRFKQFAGRGILAVDFGSKVIGLATWCPGREPFPQPYGKIIVKDDQQTQKELKTIIENEALEVVVFGIPLFADGQDSPMTTRIREFAAQLCATTSDIELHFQDETLTSFEAQERMKNSPRYGFKVDPKQLDALAAAIILEDFIRHRDSK